MHRSGLQIVCAWTFLFSTGGAWAQTETPAAPPSAPPQPAQPADNVVATVNGHDIHSSEVETTFQAVVRERTGGRPVPPEQLADIRSSLQPQIVQALIDDYLLDTAVAKADVSVTEEKLIEEMKQRLESHLIVSGTTREDFSEQVQAQTGMTIDAFIKQRASDTSFREVITRIEFFEQAYPEKMKVTEDAVLARYEEAKDQLFTQPKLVKASHILLKTEGALTPEQKEAVKQKAEEVLAEVKKPEADFAALAMERSEGPSAPRGGDLGFFPRQGAMVEPFAAAAFAMSKGQVSEVVETQFGYHIIKVTDVKEARVVPLATATDTVRDMIQQERLNAVQQELLAELRESATIEIKQ